MNSEAKTTQLLLANRIEELERTIRRIPSRFAGGGGGTTSYQWLVVGGKTISTLGVTGIERSATVIAPSTLPDGPAGTGIVIVPPWPIPVGLPSGIGVGQRVDPTASGADPIYSFLRIDNGAAGSYGSQDLVTGQAAAFAGTSFLDKVSGGTTWRYVCISSVTSYS